MKKIDGGITAASGFCAAGLNAGIKGNEKKDMAMVFSEKPCNAAGVFTTNVVKAAPVKWDKGVVDTSEFVQAIVVNSGVANACTGEEGYQYCVDMAMAAGKAVGIPKEAVLVASTGVIGRQLPMDKIKPGIEQLAKSLGKTRKDAKLAAEAIMTTDTKSKEVAVEIEIEGKKAVVAGMCKGSGMIHPNMATMLCFVVTDVAISHDMLQKALSDIVVDTFNMISVDGDTSTNDSVLLLANGMAENTMIETEGDMLQKALSDIVVDTFNMISVDGDTSTNDSVLLLANGMAENTMIETEGENYEIFRAALKEVMTALSKKIAGDGEGCTCLFEAKVKGAESKEQARILAKSIICSNLTKAAIFGHDANWGRILCAMGYSGASFDPDKVDIYFESKAGKLKIVENGVDTGYSEEKATEILSQEEVTAIADIKSGSEEATAWGCDLTYDYVKINGDYRS